MAITFAAQAPVLARAGQGFVLTDYPSERRTSQVSREGLVQRLEQLESLKSAGLIDDREYREKRQEILRGL